MVEDDTFTEVAKTDLKIRIVGGFIFGIVAALASIIYPTNYYDSCGTRRFSIMWLFLV